MRGGGGRIGEEVAERGRVFFVQELEDPSRHVRHDELFVRGREEVRNRYSLLEKKTVVGQKERHPSCKAA